MARRATTSAKKAVSRVTGAVKDTAKKLGAKLKGSRQSGVEAKPAARVAKAKPPATPERKRRPQADISLAAVSKTYTPQQTSLKAPFRANGADRQRDQEHGRGISDDTWNDEDHLTNKSGDPRIGTRGRTYEPGEKRAASKGRK